MGKTVVEDNMDYSMPKADGLDQGWKETGQNIARGNIDFVYMQRQMERIWSFL